MNPINAKSVQLIELHAFAYRLLSVYLSESFDVEKACHRQGIARALFSTLRDHCRTAPDTPRITVNSSPYAVGAYRRLGFRATGDERTVDGIRFTPMEYLFI